MKKKILNLTIIIVLLILASVISYNPKNIKKQNKIEKSIEKKGEYGFDLPLIVIDTKGEKINDIEKVSASMKVYDNKNLGLNYLSDNPKVNCNIAIKIRGNSSKVYPKKQYSLEIVDKDGQPDNKKLLGMPKENDWVLNGPFADKSLMRNYIAYTSARNIMDYAPRIRFCEVFLTDDTKKSLSNDNYKGLYVLIEKIKRDDKRVDIASSRGNIGETSFIASKDRIKEGQNNLETYGKQCYIYDNGIVLRYPTLKNATKQNIDYTNKVISEFERVLYSDKYDDPINGYVKYIDVNSFVDYYIINEFFQNTDAGTYSTYIYKNYGKKIKAGPVWDFNESMGNSNISGAYYEPKGFYLNQTAWFDRLMMDKNFVRKVIARYKVLRETYLSDEYLINNIDETSFEIANAAKRNYEVWPFELCNQVDALIKQGSFLFNQFNNNGIKIYEFMKGNPKILEPINGKSTTYKDELKMLKKFILKRGMWMDDNIEKLYKWTEK